MAITVRAAGLTLLALFAFAFNSILTRLALGAGEIDAATFTAIRILAGAIVLVVLVRAQAGSWSSLRSGGIAGPLALFAYAAPFSFAYLRIGAAVGALVLFGVVQLTMIGYAIVRGERPSLLTWIGTAFAVTGLLILTLPSVARPDPIGVMLMCVAGIAWGVYSLVGRTAPDPLAANARSFLWSSPLAIVLHLVAGSTITASGKGIALALVSGAITSGIGYAIWYRAARQLSVIQAAVAQMTVPVIAAIAAIALLHERVSVRLTISGAIVLTGVAIVLFARTRKVA